MANAFVNYTSANVGTTPVTTYTTPASTVGIIIGLNLANTTASQIAVDVQVAGVFLIKGVPIPANSSISVLDGKLILEAADEVVVTSNTATSCDVILSVLEQT